MAPVRGILLLNPRDRDLTVTTAPPGLAEPRPVDLRLALEAFEYAFDEVGPPFGRELQDFSLQRVSHHLGQPIENRPLRLWAYEVPYDCRCRGTSLGATI